jgi:hypothetical protein
MTIRFHSDKTKANYSYYAVKYINDLDRNTTKVFSFGSKRRMYKTREEARRAAERFYKEKYPYGSF